MNGDFRLITGRPSGQVAHGQATGTLPSQRTVLPPPPTHHHDTKLSAYDIAEYLNRPYLLLQKQFQYSPPSIDEQDYEGLWSLDSYTARVREGQIDHEFVISMEALSGATVPMGREEVDSLLKHSTLA